MDEPFRGKDLFLASSLYDGLEDGNLTHLKTILQRTDANPNMILPKLGVSPFHLVIGNELQNFAEEAATLFLQFGGNPNIRSVDGQTPVHIAAAWGRASLLHLLLVNGGDPWLCDGDNNNAFHLAVQGKHWDVIKILRTFHPVDSMKEEDPKQESYKLTLEKVFIYNRDTAAEYGNTSELKSGAKNTSSVGTQTWQNVPWISNQNARDTGSVTNHKIKNLNFYPEVETSKNTSSIKMVNCGNMQEKNHTFPHKSNSCEALGNDSTHKFPTLSFRKQLLEEIKSFHKKRNTKEIIFHTESSLENCENENLEKCYKVTDNRPSAQLKEQHTVDSNIDSSCVRNSNVNAKSDNKTEKDETTYFCTSKNRCKTYSDCDLISEKENIIHKLETHSGIKENESSDCNNVPILEFNKMNLANKFTLCNMSPEEEWIASQSCFEVLDNNEYTTCNEDLPLFISPEVCALKLPCNSEENPLCQKHESYKPESVRHDSVSSSSTDSGSYMSLSEEYKYLDKKEGVVLLEKRFLVPPISVRCLQSENGNTSKLSSDISGTGVSVTSDSSSAPSSLNYDTDLLRNSLKARGFNPGPILPSTKKLYLRKLVKLEKKPVIISSEAKVYSPELQRTLLGFKWQLNLSEYIKLEKEVDQQFSQPQPGRRWREGNIKSSFTYLLLDPRITDNLPCRLESLDKLQVWSIFLSAIFYVGKGKRSRPYSHLYQAFSVWNKNIVKTLDKKVQHILDIWKAGMGVVCLHVFQNVIPVEAYTREAAMIDAVGLQNLRNAKCGEYYGLTSTWTSHQKRMLGTFLLYRAMLIFLHEGERQLRPGDIG